MVEEMLAVRGIEGTYETVRSWVLQFGQEAARRIQARTAAIGDKWHLDEVVITINSKKHWLWRSVDQFGVVLNVLFQSRRDRYAAANKDMGLKCEYRRQKGLNNRAENSNQPTRVLKKIMRRFKSARQLQRFVSVYDQVASLFQS